MRYKFFVASFELLSITRAVGEKRTPVMSRRLAGKNEQYPDASFL